MSSFLEDVSPLIKEASSVLTNWSGSCMLGVEPPWIRPVHHILQMLDRIGIWGIWRPSQHLGLFIVFLEWFLSSVCGVSCRGATAIGWCCCDEGVCLVNSLVCAILSKHNFMSRNLFTDCVSCLCSVLQTPAERSRVSNEEQQDQQVGDVDCFVVSFM